MLDSKLIQACAYESNVIQNGGSFGRDPLPQVREVVRIPYAPFQADAPRPSSSSALPLGVSLLHFERVFHPPCFTPY